MCFALGSLDGSTWQAGRGGCPEMQQPVIEGAGGSNGVVISSQLAPICPIPEALLVRVLLRNFDAASAHVCLEDCTAWHSAALSLKVVAVSNM